MHTGHLMLLTLSQCDTQPLLTLQPGHEHAVLASTYDAPMLDPCAGARANIRTVSDPCVHLMPHESLGTIEVALRTYRQTSGFCPKQRTYCQFSDTRQLI